MLIALVPFYVHGPALALTVVLLIALMNFPQSLTGLSWQSLMGDLIPEDRRAAFFGRRNRITTFVGMLATLLPGLILQRFPAVSIPPYQAFFILSALFSILEVLYLHRHREHVDRQPDKAAPALMHPGLFVAYLRRRSYRSFLIGTVIFNFGWQMAWPLYNIYQIDFAGATAFWVSLFTVANQITQIATFSYWGRLSERFGNTLLLGVAYLGMALNPVLTIASRNMLYLTAMNLGVGVFIAGVLLLQFNHLLEVVPAEERTSYIAHYNIVTGLVGFLAPQAGVWLLQLLHMDISMTVAAIIRAAGAVFFFITVKHSLSLPSNKAAVS